MAVRDPFSNITSDGFCEKHFHEKNNNTIIHEKLVKLLFQMINLQFCKIIRHIIVNGHYVCAFPNSRAFSSVVVIGQCHICFSFFHHVCLIYLFLIVLHSAMSGI